MAVTKQALIDSLSASIDLELDALIEGANKEPHVFSDRFEKSMEEMIRTCKPDKLWSDVPSNTGSKKKKLTKKGLRVLLIAAAIIVALTAVACAVPEIRESIAGFFVRIFSDHVEYFDPAITKERIEEEYGLVPVPDGFVVSNSSITNYDVLILYIDDGNNTIIFRQIAGNSYSGVVDCERGGFSEKNIGGKTVRFYYSHYSAQASWIENGYYFSLSFTSFIDEQVFESWIQLVNVIE